MLLHLSALHTCLASTEQEEDIEYSGTRMTEICEPRFGCWEPNLDRSPVFHKLNASESRDRIMTCSRLYLAALHNNLEVSIEKNICKCIPWGESEKLLYSLAETILQIFSFLYT